MTSRLPTHPYQWDGITDPRALTPVEYCTCGLPRRHERHPEGWPEVDPDVADLEQRRIGEREQETR